MASACDHCAKSIKSDEHHVECMGFCKNAVHVKCTKPNGPFMRIVAENSNLFWMCNECVKLMKIARFRDTISSLGGIIDNIQTSYTALKEEINKNSQQLALISKRIFVAAPNQGKLVASREKHTPKRRREDDHNNEDDRRGDDPGRGRQLIFGSKSVLNAKLATVPPPVELFWLYVCRFVNSTTALQVENVVKDAIGPDVMVQAVPLVKRGVDPLTLKSISFKVGVDPKHKDAVMNPEVWPGGCGFREFDEHQQKNSLSWPSKTPPSPTNLSTTPAGSSSVPTVPDTPICPTPVAVVTMEIDEAAATN